MSSYIYNFILVFGAKLQSLFQELLNIKFILLVIAGSKLVIRMFSQVVLVGKERSDTSKLQDTFAAIHDTEFIDGHQIMAELLVIQGMAFPSAFAFTCIIGIDRLFAQCLIEILHGSRFTTAQEDLAVAVADDGIGVIL